MRPCPLNQAPLVSDPILFLAEYVVALQRYCLRRIPVDRPSMVVVVAMFDPHISSSREEDDDLSDDLFDVLSTPSDSAGNVILS